MAIYETFSKRIKRLSKPGQQDVYQYSKLPEGFRVQIVHIWNDAMPPDHHEVTSAQDWKLIHDLLARELGVLNLASGNSQI